MAKAKGRVTFDEGRCKGCELCTRVCPVKIVVMDTKRINSKGYHPAAVMEIDKCIGCANCAVMCPDTAIRVEQEFI
ncbi:MAG: 4Fe-4S dicluster domain-containing protein [Gracilibacteraceae bacterium]|jgi:2-oxoglutarate ferredoxin oxidoreductase subunit delta|nr:4Fe-4S dicluster domain-containing protein [Gracilibacteraceae bacterium]